MGPTRQQMDDQVNQHFMYEATNDIDGGDGKSGHASFRLLHVFESAADGKIKSERVWVDLAAIQQQLS